MMFDRDEGDDGIMLGIARMVPSVSLSLMLLPLVLPLLAPAG